MKKKIQEIWKQSVRYTHEREYMGIDPYDGLNSPYLSRLGGESKFLRIILTHMVKDAPVNLRPVLGIGPEKNPKGIALFALCYNDVYRITGNMEYDNRAQWLVEWLLKHRTDEGDGTYWGYNFPWQSGRSFLPSYGPCSVVTYFVTEAVRLIHHDHQLLERVATFYLEHLNRLVDDEDQLCLSYTPFESEKIVNSNALIAHQLAELGVSLRRDEYMENAKRIVDWVLSQQDTDGGWFYSPTSHLKKDNFHNGYVIWALMKYWKVVEDPVVLRSIKKGLRFYRSLFEENGMPVFSKEKKYPIDIHNCSQGLITFKEAERLGLHRKGFYNNILGWTLDNMWDRNDHYFYYQKHRFWTNKTPYMRWSQAWMAYALSSLLKRDHP
ncbi:MAG: hypothetical protein R6U17_05445 [Thermoplasmata archaeon]